MLPPEAATAPAAEQAVPMLQPWQDILTAQPIVAGIVLVVMGVAFLLYGFRLYRVLVIVAYAGIGLVGGLALSQYFVFNPLLGALPGAVVAGLLAWPLHRLGWGLLGGAALAFMSAAIAAASGVENPVAIGVVAAVAFGTGVILTMILFRPLIIVTTSIMGASLASEGLMRLLSLWPDVGGQAVSAVESQPLLAVAGILVVAAAGATLQVFDTSRLGSRGRKDQS